MLPFMIAARPPKKNNSRLITIDQPAVVHDR
jgi:hypothetical protein